jgi:hypothetical protein
VYPFSFAGYIKKNFKLVTLTHNLFFKRYINTIWRLNLHQDIIFVYRTIRDDKTQTINAHLDCISANHPFTREGFRPSDQHSRRERVVNQSQRQRLVQKVNHLQKVVDARGEKVKQILARAVPIKLAILQGKGMSDSFGH